MKAALRHPAPISEEDYSAVELSPEGDEVLMLDQRLLPREEVYHRLRTAEEVAEAIRAMVIRGAPAIGIGAAYGMALAARGSEAAAMGRLEHAARLLARSRPTAVNLFWAIERMLGRARRESPSNLAPALAEEARAIHREDVAACKTMGRLGAEWVPDGATILTHCNAGALATGGYGTALGVIRAAKEAGKRIRVLADETRPYLQGARLTAWELHRSGIEVQVICDNAAGHLFARGEVTLTVVGSDRVARNGDVANKIGTYALACLSRFHDRPFFVAAPWSTLDAACESGAEIPIEQRNAREITHLGSFGGAAASRGGEGGGSAGPGSEPRDRIVPEGVGVLNPAFDVTPAPYVTALFTERGVLSPLTPQAIFELLEAGEPSSGAASGERAADGEDVAGRAGASGGTP